MSGSALVADLHPAPGYDHRNPPLPVGMFQHLLQCNRVPGHIQVFDNHLLAPVVLTGLDGMRSGVFAENQHFFLHKSSRNWITWIA